jgi:hypothetical protein
VSSTMVEGWQGTMPPSPFSKRAASDGSEAAVHARTGTGSAPLHGDPGGATLASSEPLSVPPPGAALPDSRMPPPPLPPSGETSIGAHLDRATYAEAAARAGTAGARQQSTLPKVRDSGLGTSTATGTILEESLRMMRDSANCTMTLCVQWNVLKLPCMTDVCWMSGRR